MKPTTGRAQFTAATGADGSETTELAAGHCATEICSADADDVALLNICVVDQGLAGDTTNHHQVALGPPAAGV